MTVIVVVGCCCRIMRLITPIVVNSEQQLLPLFLRKVASTDEDNVAAVVDNGAY